jgi:hypothetical protein
MRPSTQVRYMEGASHNAVMDLALSRALSGMCATQRSMRNFETLPDTQRYLMSSSVTTY